MKLTSDLQSPSLKKILNFSGVLLITVIYSVLWAFLFNVSHAFWYLPAGLRFVTLVYLRPVYWPVVVLGEFLAITYLNGEYDAYPSVFDHVLPSILPSMIYAVVLGLLLRNRAWISRGVANQSELLTITLAIVSAALVSATSLFLLMPGDSPFLVFEKFSAQGVFSYALGDTAGVLFIWSTVAFIRSFIVMENSERVVFATRAIYLVLPVSVVIALLSPVFAWASLALMFIPIVLMALSHGWPGATFSLMMMNITAGLGFLQSGNTGELFDNQVFLVSVGFTGLFLGAAVSHQSELMERIRKFSQRVITTQETERNRIAQDVHDHIGQVLTALTLRVAILKKRAPDELESDFDLLEKLAGEVFQDVHDIVGELSPRELLHFGLKRSLEGPVFHKMLETAGISYLPNIDAGVSDIPEQTQIALYRISQEAISNISKYSEATRCTLNLGFIRRQGKTRVRLEIQDNGTGFDTHLVKSGHGLQNIEDRVQSLLGGFVITSGKDGTHLDITLPV